MHYVDRGKEPISLERVRNKYTAGWVRFYRDGDGAKPTDAKWQDYHSEMSSVFFGRCAYCEEPDKGEVDHFRPKSKDPHLVYEWTNWVFACHTCNNKKLQKWPTAGYIDPCASSKSYRAELYFEYDTKTGEMLPKSDLSTGRRRKAVRMIKDLGLNAFHHLKRRAEWLQMVSLMLEGESDAKRVERIEFFVSRETELSSITRVWITEQGLSFGD